MHSGWSNNDSRSSNNDNRSTAPPRPWRWPSAGCTRTKTCKQTWTGQAREEATSGSKKRAAGRRSSARRHLVADSHARTTPARARTPRREPRRPRRAWAAPRREDRADGKTRGRALLAGARGASSDCGLHRAVNATAMKQTDQHWHHHRRQRRDDRRSKDGRRSKEPRDGTQRRQTICATR